MPARPTIEAPAPSDSDEHAMSHAAADRSQTVTEAITARRASLLLGATGVLLTLACALAARRASTW